MFKFAIFTIKRESRVNHRLSNESAFGQKYLAKHMKKNKNGDGGIEVRISRLGWGEVRPCPGVLFVRRLRANLRAEPEEKTAPTVRREAVGLPPTM